jgi:hypothetical protein
VGRRRNEPQPDGWKKKLHSAFFELAEVNQEFEERWAKMQDAWRQELEVADRADATNLQNKIAVRVSIETSQLENGMRKSSQT